MSRKSKQENGTIRDHARLYSTMIKIGMLLVVLLTLYAASVSTRFFYSAVAEHLARSFINTPRSPDAERAAIRAVMLNPDNGYALYYLGSIYYGQQRFEDAKRNLLKSLRSIAHPATPLLLLAEINLIQKNFDSSLDYFKKTFRMNPHPTVEPAKRWYSFGKAAANAGNNALAINAYQHAISLGISIKDIHQSLGAQFIRLNLPLMAVYEYERQIMLIPDFNQPYIDLAAVLRFLNDTDEGIRFFSKMYKQDKRLPETYTFLSIFLIRDKKEERAINVLKEFLADYPDETSALLLLGQAYFNLHDRENAEQYLRAYLKTNPSPKSKQQADQILSQMRSW